MSAVLPRSRARTRSPSAAPLGPASRALVLRVVLLAGVAAAVALATGLAAGAPALATEPSLVRLLRGMALIKGGLVAVAVVLSAWRFGRPVSSPAVSGYCLGTWALCAATTLIWHLRFIPAAALVFHVAMVGLLVLAWREGRAGPDSRGV